MVEWNKVALFTKDNGQWKIDSGYWTMGVYDQKPKKNKRTILSLLFVIDKIKELGMYYNFIIKELATNKQIKQKEDPLQRH